jgi:hypothetical protein
MAMAILSYGSQLTVFCLALCLASTAEAQVDLDQGKTAGQLFASDCAVCHKSPQSVARARWVSGLESFLREHYTSNSESAAALSAYLKALTRSKSGAVTGTRQTMQPETTRNDFIEEDIPRPPVDIPMPSMDVRPNHR